MTGLTVVLWTEECVADVISGASVDVVSPSNVASNVASVGSFELSLMTRLIREISNSPYLKSF